MAVRSGGAHGIGLGLGGEVQWQKEQDISAIERESVNAVHGFYNLSLNFVFKPSLLD